MEVLLKECIEPDGKRIYQLGSIDDEGLKIRFVREENLLKNKNAIPADANYWVSNDMLHALNIEQIGIGKNSYVEGDLQYSESGTVFDTLQKLAGYSVVTPDGDVEIPRYPKCSMSTGRVYITSSTKQGQSRTITLYNCDPSKREKTLHLRSIPADLEKSATRRDDGTWDLNLNKMYISNQNDRFLAGCLGVVFLYNLLVWREIPCTILKGLKSKVKAYNQEIGNVAKYPNTTHVSEDDYTCSSKLSSVPKFAVVQNLQKMGADVFKKTAYGYNMDTVQKVTDELQSEIDRRTWFCFIAKMYTREAYKYLVSDPSCDFIYRGSAGNMKLSFEEGGYYE